jgi:hypothetical protein
LKFPLLLPREHGAWGLLLQPFIAGAILGRRWDWLLIPALMAVLLSFIIREPLITLARQRWVWRERKPDTALALRCLAWQVPLLLAIGVLLLFYLPPAPLAAMAAMGAAITLLAVYLTLRNRQRSISFQMISSAALSVTVLLAALVATRQIPAWSWIAWALLSLHGLASILVVHARLDARSGSRSGLVRIAVLWQAGQLVAAAALASALAFPVAFSAVVNLAELWRLRSPQALREKLTHVGFRTLAYAIAHMILTIVVLWPRSG